MTTPKNSHPLLEVQDLKTYYSILRGKVKAVDGVSFPVEKGEAMGLAGESGCGKSTIALSILRILPKGGTILGGKILFSEIDLVELPEEYIREKIRWKGISVVFQGAMNALNPVYKVGDQIVESMITHEPETSKEEAQDRTRKLLELVGINPLRADNYPHEYSGGMRQRALIAMSLACDPQLLIADEPGTALDVIVQAQILKLLRELKEKLGLTMILITHDLSIISEVCDKCSIMYAGRIVEYGNIKTVFKEPLHPYTQGLIAAFPQLTGPKVRMTSIPGSPPDLLDPPQGCRFHPRCQYAMDICRKVEPVSEEIEKDHLVECHLFAKHK